MIRIFAVFAALALSTGLFADSLVWEVTGSNMFGRLDLNTDAFTPVSNLGFTPAGLGEIGSTLYTADENGTTLFAVNTVTGTTRAVGNASNTSYYVFGSTTTGLYMVDTAGGLWNIDPATGSSTLIGSTQLSTNNNNIALSTGFNVLYLSLGSNVYSINTSTGQSSFIGTSGSTDFGALVNVGNTVYGTAVVGFNSVYTFDPITGTAAFFSGPNGSEYAWGLAAIVPEPKSVALLGFGLLVCLLGGFTLNRQRA